MNCSSAETLFDRFLEDALPAGQRGELVSHVDVCGACNGVLAELRVVDRILGTPRNVELAANFTFATMAEARALPAPQSASAPLRAYLVSYLAGAWLLCAAAMVLAPQSMHALGGTTLDIARTIAATIGGLGAVIGRVFGRGGSLLTALLGALLALDALVVAGFSFALRYLRPRLVERLRS